MRVITARCLQASICPACCCQPAPAKEGAAAEPQAEVKPGGSAKAQAAQVGVAVKGDEKALAAKPEKKPLHTKPMVKISVRVKSDGPSSASQRERANYQTNLQSAYMAGRKATMERGRHPSITIQASDSSALVGSNKPYAAMMHFGGKKQDFPHLWGDIPSRDYLPMDAEGQLQPGAGEAILDLAMEHLEKAVRLYSPWKRFAEALAPVHPLLQEPPSQTLSNCRKEHSR